MAATQAQTQPNNDVKESPNPNLVSGSNANFTNGTDCRSLAANNSDVLGTKGVKRPTTNNIGVELDMSQYRQVESGPPVNNTSATDQHGNSSDENSGNKIGAVSDNKQFVGGGGHEQSSGGNEVVNYGSKTGIETGPNVQYGGPGGLPYQQRPYSMHGPEPGPGPMQHMGPEGPLHHQPQPNSYGHFNPGLRAHPGYGGPKGARPPPPPVHAGPPGFNQRFVPGPGPGPGNQPTGPTPTLNQLLQSSNNVHRYQNNYGDYPGPGKQSGDPQSGGGPPQQPGNPQPMGGYNQGWAPRPMAPYPQQSSPYRQQPPPGSRAYGTTGGSGYPSAASPSQQFPPQPYRNSYQLGGSGNNNGAIVQGAGDRVGSGSWSPGPQVPPQSQNQGPQGPHSQQEPPSPQQQPPQQPPPPQQQVQPPPQPQPPPNQHQQLQSQQVGMGSGPRAAEQSPTRHAPDQGDLSGQNSNDSSSGGGPAPGTPNSQSMRPTPSPTGSSGSRSMSPAVGQQSIAMPPRPSSGQSDSGNGPTSQHSRMSPMTNQATPPLPIGQGGGYPGAGAPHMHNYKMSSHQMSPHPPPQSQQIPPYSPQAPQHQYQSNYPVRGGIGYSGPGGYQGPPGGMPPGGGLAPQSQYPPRGSSAIPNHVQYPPSPYQHKVGYGSNMPPSPGSYNSHGSMGPPAPHHPGMPPPPPPLHDGPMPPPAPASTPTQHEAHESQIITSNAGSGNISTVTSSNVPSGPPGTTNVGVTSIVTTGPDGTALDEASQQSTLSNASAASGDDGSYTPVKSRKDGSGSGMMGYHSHPTTPQSSAPSPGAASHNSILDEYPPDNSPSWPRTPASPVFNSHVPQDLYRPKKQHDSLSKLYEMDDSHDRRMWLDKLLHFMDERGSPITVCPTISKNPLDLYRLYHYVKERGGFMEVTKNKIWKDIAGLLGIGASSSAAYTLRKHYTKNLLPFECHFDRGGIDPQPIINQVEATSKKKSPKAAPVPSPGSSNSQDSFQGPGGSMDGYGGYSYSQDYNNQQRPPSQSSQGVGVPPNHEAHNVSVSNPFDDHPASPRGPRTGMPPSGNYQAQPGGGYNQPYGEQYGQQYSGSYPGNRPMYPPYGGPDPDSRVFNQGTGAGSGASGGPPCPPTIGSGSSTGGPVPPNSAQEYNRYSSSGPGIGPPGSGSTAGNYPPSGPGGPRVFPTQGPPPGSPSPSGTPPTQQPPQQGSMPPGNTPSSAPPQQQQQQQPPYQSSGPPQPQSEFYNRQDGYPGGPGVSYQPGPPTGPNKNMPPPAPQPRRHPDFVKESQQPPYPGYGPHRPNMYPAGWSNSSNSGFRGQYPGGGSPGPQQWVQSGSRPAGPPNHQPTSGQWAPQPNFTPNQAQPGWAPPGVSQTSPLRPPIGGPRPPFRPDSKPAFQAHGNIPPPGVKGPGIATYSQPGSNSQVKRELVFPVDSVEATAPVLYKRRRMTKAEVAPIDAWRIMMALKSGLLSETCWALDVLNILLFDDTTVTYFGLLHLPGLMDILLEHMKKALYDMLEPTPVTSPFNEEVKEVTSTDLGAITQIPDPNDRVSIARGVDYTTKTRKGYSVTIATDSDDIFVSSSKKLWDAEDVIDDSVEQDGSNYIVSSFRAEFGNIPFFRKLTNSKEKSEVIKQETDCDVREVSVDKSDERKSIERSIKKKSKSLSDVLSRIKKEPAEEDRCNRDRETTPELHERGLESEPEAAPPTSSPPPSVTPVLSPFSTVKEEPPNTVKSEVEDANEGSSENSNSELQRECKIGMYNIHDPAGTLKRRRIEDYEDECYTRDEASLYLVCETQDYIARRCICLSSIFRNLTFVPGNELEFAKSGTFLGLVGKLLLLHHEHPPRIPKQRKYDRDEEPDFGDCCSSLQGDGEWWWEFLHHLRENALVSIANIAGHVDLGLYPEDISRPILDGLLHWAVCPAAQGQDPFPTVSPSSSLSPQRLALEALCKLCVTDSNVDLVIATPPYCRLERLAAVLTRLLCRSEEQVLREFAVNLLYFLGAADSGMARTIAMQNPCVSQLVGFIEQAEQSALGVANQHGLSALRENPDCMGTSLDMLRRAARTLLHLAGHPDNWPLFLQQEQRLLTLVMSQILDQQVASIIAMVLYTVSRASSSLSSSTSSSSSSSSPPPSSSSSSVT